MASHDDPTLGFGTRAIHAGQVPDATTGAVMTPIYYTSTYAQSGPGVHKGFEYSRTHNLTRFALEANLASLESGTAGLCFASGLAATSTLLQLFDAGTHVVACDDLYGGTFRLFDKVYRRLGFEFTYVDPLRGADAVAAAIKPTTRLVWGGNPDQPDAQAGRHRRGLGGVQAARRAARGRQHVPDPVLPAPARSRRRHRRALDDQVPQRPLRRGRRRPDRQGSRAARPARVPAECRRRRAVADGQLPGPARHQDPARPHGAPRQQRARAGELARAPPAGREGELPRAAVPPAARSGAP